jgi:tetratricopeptide (TPR) repeat protein
MLSARPQERSFSYVRSFFSGARNYAEDFWVTVSRTAIALTVLLLAFSLRPLVLDKSFVIGEFSVPDELKGKGIASETIGHQLFERITEIQRVAKAAVAEKNLSVREFESNQGVAKLADVKLPGADLNMALVVSQLRSFFRIADTKLTGELGITKSGPTPEFEVRAYVSGTEVWSKVMRGSELRTLVTGLADELVEHFDPLSAGFFALRRPSSSGENLEHVIEITDQTQPKTQQEAAWTLTLRGMAWREKQGSADRTYASLCGAISVDPSFTPAWRILAGSLRDNGQLATAKDLALRLIRLQPRDPEGRRQLAAVYNDCVDGPEKPPATTFFEQAQALGDGRYLTYVDYGRWLYNHFDSDRPEYLDRAVEYFEKARALAPTEPSVYTNLARALGHPRLSKKEEQNETATRHMKAEMMARHALALDDHSPFANFVMGELMTDEAALALKSKERKKFAEAAIHYLQKSRDLATVPLTLYEAFFARAKAAQGDFEGAEQVLTAIRQQTSQPSYLVEWVQGEMLYNRAQQSSADKESLLNEALSRLQQARSLHACGARSDIITDLIARIQKRLEDEHPETVAVTSESAVDLPTGRSATDSRKSISKGEPTKWSPVCAGWQKSDINPAAPFEPDPALMIALPTFDAR